MTGLTFQFRIGALHRISLQRRIASGWFQKCKYFISFCKHMYLFISYVYKVLHYDRPTKTCLINIERRCENHVCILIPCSLSIKPDKDNVWLKMINVLSLFAFCSKCKICILKGSHRTTKGSQKGQRPVKTFRCILTFFQCAELI